MQRLNGVDSAFLSLETPTMHMHIVGVILLDPSTLPGGYSFEGLKRLIISRLHRMPPFYRRVRRVPLGIEHPYWVNDPNFDIDNHVRRATIPAPGGSAELGKLVGEIASKKINRDRPLWEITVVEGLEGGNVALITKMHHAAADGMASGYLMLQLLDMSPELPELTEEPFICPADEDPSDVEIFTQAFRDRLKNPSRIREMVKKTVNRVTDIAGQVLLKGTENFAPTMPFNAPKTMFNRAISPDRVAAFGSAPLSDFRYIRKVFGCTVNDVVIAACTGALRRYLEQNNDLPNRALMASCPISIRTPEQTADCGNRVSTLFVGMPVQIEDPIERLQAIMSDTKDAKTLHNAMGAEMLQDWAELAAPYAFTYAARMYTRMKLADRHAPVHNLIVSNVPGPPFDLFCLGARVVQFFPLGPVLEGAGLNLTVVSRAQDMDIGIMACPLAAPNPDLIAKYFGEATKELRELAEQYQKQQELAPV